MFNAVDTRAEVAIDLLVAVGHNLVRRAPTRIVWPPGASPYAALVSALPFIFAREQLFTQRLQIHIGIPCLSEHPARLLLFFDVVFDHLGQHGDSCIEVVIVRRHSLNLGNECFRARMLDDGLMVNASMNAG
jgi:hypothetical protein